MKAIDVRVTLSVRYVYATYFRIYQICGCPH